MLRHLSAACWHLVKNDGSIWDPDDDDGGAHFEMEIQAQERITALRYRGDGAAATPKLFNGVCVVVTCDECDEGPEDGVWGEIHFPDESTARSMASAYGFTIDPDGSAWCEGCNECRKVVV